MMNESAGFESLKVLKRHSRILLHIIAQQHRYEGRGGSVGRWVDGSSASPQPSFSAGTIGAVARVPEPEVAASGAAACSADEGEA